MADLQMGHSCCQPFSVDIRGAEVVAPAGVLGGSWSGAFPFTPAFDFDPAPTGKIACSDGHRVGERNSACPNQDGLNPHQNGANPYQDGEVQ